jgi:hypothetical protein
MILVIIRIMGTMVTNFDPEDHGDQQSFGSKSGLDPDSIRSVDPDPYLESGSGSGSRGAKMTHKSRKFLKFNVLKCWVFSFES